jgi:hypothetical protein
MVFTTVTVLGKFTRAPPLLDMITRERAKVVPLNV